MKNILLDEIMSIVYSNIMIHALLLTMEVYTMQTANMIAHAKSTFIPVTESE